MALEEDAIEIAALGRPFQLGTLYDCRKDVLIPGVTLWDYNSLQKDLTIKPQPKTATEIIASDSIDDKASALDISGPIKASFLGGLIDMRGSAEYLHDFKKSKQQARITIQYKTTTKYEQLTMSHLGIQNVSHPTIFEHGTATHVVTAILYGAQAFFVFDREVSSTETVKNIQGSLQLTVKKLISITGEAEVKLTEEEKENAVRFSCKFHGDFSLEKNPVTFQDAVKVYETLPKMLGKDGENAVPMRVWLYPLSKLDTRAAKMVREISLTLIFDAEKILEELNEIRMQSNDLANDPIAETFPEIKQKILQFKDLCKQHRQTFQKQLARMLPSIRGGRQEEGILVDLLMSVNESPFNSQRLCEFLKTKKREINIVKSYLTILSEIKVISSENEMEEIVLHPQNVHVVSFIFTSLHEEEPFLLRFQSWLQEKFLPESPKSTSPPEVKKGLAWFEDQETTHNARQDAKYIKDFFSINQSNEKVRYVVASLPDVATPGASIYLYEDGQLVSKNFELPSKPLPFLISELRHDSIQLKFQPAEYGKASISNYAVEYKVAGEETWKTVRTEDTREMFVLKDLSPNVAYLFQYAACCKIGLSKSSDLSPPIKTLPTSPPEKLIMVTAASSVISVAWMSPSIVASGVAVKEYKVEYRTVEAGVGKDQWTGKMTGRKSEFYPIEGLRPQTVYRIRVSAMCDNGALGAPSKEVEISTSLEEKQGADNVAHQFLQEISLVEDSQPFVFTLPLEKVALDASTSCLMYQLGKENLEVPNKVILMMGVTGCGKTTLINGMINYILGVQWRNNFRVKMIHETTQRSKAGSRTSKVTAYVVNHQKGFQIPYSLTIIDTPGFGGSRDAEQDKLVEEQLQEFFFTPGGIDHVDAICLVAQAFLAHSTHTQKCIFDSMFSMLGKDVKENIQLLITFAGERSPPVLEALKEADLPCAQEESGTPLHFRFNYSSFFAHQGNRNAAPEMFWEMSTESMKNFFDSLNMMETKSLTLTMEVLKRRQELEAALRRPPSLNVEPIQQNCFQISIYPLTCGMSPVSRYLVEYRIAGEKNWKSLLTVLPKDKFTLEDVRLNLPYQFRCTAVTQLTLGQWSEEITCVYPSKSQVLCGATGPEMIASIRGPERRIVLVGKTGNGKSATGNTILGSHVFQFRLSYKSETKACQKEETQLNGRKVVVVDTPGFFDTSRPQEVIAAEVSKCVKLCSPGPHIILHIMHSHRFSQEKDMPQLIKEIFGLKAKDYTILLFTRKDYLEGESLENVIPAIDENLKEYIAECGNRFLAFNNRAEGAEREAQVAKLMTMIDDLVHTNRYAPCYTEEMMNVSKRHNL